MVKSFDLLVLGTGSAGSKPTRRCREAGWSVAVVDSRPFGGTCSLRGCDAKKVFVGAAEAIERADNLREKKIIDRTPSIDWPHLHELKRSLIDERPQSVEASFKKAGIETFHGKARFTGADKVEVNGEELQAKHIVIATGAVPRELDIEGKEQLIDSTQFLALETIPKRIVFVGGGFISFELAHAVARAGTKATIIHQNARPLEGFEPELVDRLVAETRRIGIEVRLNAQVTKIEGGRVFTKSGDTIEADLVVHGAGRVPDLDELDLEKAQVEREKKGVRVNAFLQSPSNPRIYAAGDVAATGAPMLTPVAALEGHVVASNLLHGNTTKADYRGVPSVVFTIPSLARVGVLEAEAKHAKVKLEDMSEWYSTQRVGAHAAAAKVLIDEETDRILGASILSAHAEETINLFALAIRHDIPASALKRFPWSYPSLASDISYLV